MFDPLTTFIELYSLAIADSCCQSLAKDVGAV